MEESCSYLHLGPFRGPCNDHNYQAADVYEGSLGSHPKSSEDDYED